MQNPQKGDASGGSKIDNDTDASILVITANAVFGVFDANVVYTVDFGVVSPDRTENGVRSVSGSIIAVLGMYDRSDAADDCFDFTDAGFKSVLGESKCTGWADEDFVEVDAADAGSRDSVVVGNTTDVDAGVLMKALVAAASYEACFLLSSMAGLYGVSTVGSVDQNPSMGPDMFVCGDRRISNTLGFGIALNAEVISDAVGAVSDVAGNAINTDLGATTDLSTVLDRSERSISPKSSSLGSGEGDRGRCYFPASWIWASLVLESEKRIWWENAMLTTSNGSSGMKMNGSEPSSLDSFDGGYGDMLLTPATVTSRIGVLTTPANGT